MAAHTCPYDGERPLTALEAEAAGCPAWRVCGSRGFLCDRCREDRADARVRLLTTTLDRLIEAIGDRP